MVLLAFIDSWWSWCLRWRRVRFEWEALQEEDMLRIISSCSINRELKDNQIWGGDISGEFSVKSAYEFLAYQDSSLSLGIFNQFWQVKAFPNGLATAWRVLLNKMSTQSNMIR